MINLIKRLFNRLFGRVKKPKIVSVPTPPAILHDLSQAILKPARMYKIGRVVLTQSCPHCNHRRIHVRYRRRKTPLYFCGHCGAPWKKTRKLVLA